MYSWRWVAQWPAALLVQYVCTVVVRESTPAHFSYSTRYVIFTRHVILKSIHICVHSVIRLSMARTAPAQLPPPRHCLSASLPLCLCVLCVSVSHWPVSAGACPSRRQTVQKGFVAILPSQLRSGTAIARHDQPIHPRSLVRREEENATRDLRRRAGGLCCPPIHLSVPGPAKINESNQQHDHLGVAVVSWAGRET